MRYRVFCIYCNKGISFEKFQTSASDKVLGLILGHNVDFKILAAHKSSNGPMKPMFELEIIN